MLVRRPSVGCLAILAVLAGGCGDDSTPFEGTPPDRVAAASDSAVATEAGSSAADAQAAADAVVDGTSDAGTGPVVKPSDAGGSGTDATALGVDASQPSDTGVTPQPDASTTGDAGPVTSGDNDKALFVPHASWTCGMPQGIPPPALGSMAFRAEFAVTTDRDVGDTQYGKRRILEFGTGTISGPQLEGTLRSGGYELHMQRDNGVVEIEQILMLTAKGNANIYLRVCGVAPSPGERVRAVMDFEAPTASHAALNTAKLVGVRELSADGKRLTLTVYDVGKVTPPSSSVRIELPAGTRPQLWECLTLKGTKGPEVYRETVQIGGSVRVGDSKRGTRNVIPITGGTTSGKIQGKILPLGADFQILGSPFVIDARYVVVSNSGDPVIVRNCGVVGSLVPTFEARTAGPFGFLNEDKWLSSDPSIGLGTVSLTIYEKK